jgi:hypothetical protein
MRRRSRCHCWSSRPLFSARCRWLRTVQAVGPAHVGFYHRPRSFSERCPDQRPQDIRVEFEIDPALDVGAAFGCGVERPYLLKALEQGIVTGDFHAVRPVQRCDRREPFVKKGRPHRHLDPEGPVAAAGDPGRDDPRYEVRILLNIHDQIEQVRGRVSRTMPLSMFHGLANILAGCAAGCSISDRLPRGTVHRRNDAPAASTRIRPTRLLGRLHLARR